MERNQRQVFNGIIGTIQPKQSNYQPIAIGDIRTVSEEEWAEHWRPHGSGWRNPSVNNVCYLQRAYGGSDMSAIMECSHFKPKLELFNQKAGLKPVFTRNGNSDAKELGHLYEPVTAMKYHRQRRKSGAQVTMLIEGKVIKPDGSTLKDANGNIVDQPLSMMMYRDGRRKKNVKQDNNSFIFPWALANCDGLLQEHTPAGTIQGILEIKTTSPENYEVIDNWKAGIVPEGYFWQCIYYMAILNVQFCDICCSWGQPFDKMSIIRIYRDYDVEQRLFSAISEFDEYVEQCIEPSLDSEDGALLNNYYYELFGPVNEKAPMIELPEKYRSTVQRAIDVQTEIKNAQIVLAEANAKAEKIFSELYPIFKTSGYGQFRLNDTEVAGITLKTPMKRAKLDEDKFKQDYPQLYEQCKVFSCTELGALDKRLKKQYMLPPEPDLEDKTKHPSFSLKILKRAI